MEGRLRQLAREAPGFMPEAEGLALYECARVAGLYGPLLEIGTYCGKSAVYLGAAAREAGTVLFTIDHHRGSEEHQPGQEYYDPTLVDADGRVDTLPCFRRTIAGAGLEDRVIAIVGNSFQVSRWWKTPIALLFLDGGHSEMQAFFDYEFARHLLPHGMLAIHDVFEDPKEGGQPPLHVRELALLEGFEPVGSEGSLRLLRRPGS